ncbi:MAG: hypothetical protein KAU01_02200 [Candidatus Cloacimonetes bacterium]|nr:hypothetical protein [Candidatus Cloacimonadota bacterium]
MKKTFLFIILLSLLTLLEANFLIDVYHKDYGVIDRIVLVLATKPQYSILKHEGDIQINFSNCRKDATIQNMKVPNSEVLQGFYYLIAKDKVMVIITINQARQLITGERYQLETMELKGEVFKLVLDIFTTKNPKTVEELKSFANFYEMTDKKDLAAEYKSIAEKLEAEQVILVQEDSSLKTKITTEKLIQVFKPPTFFETLKSIMSKKMLIILSLGIILIIVMIFLLISVLKKKESEPEFEEKSLRSTVGFGKEKFQKKIVMKLAENGWNSEEIAKEMELLLEDVHRMRGSDFEEDLERI